MHPKKAVSSETRLQQEQLRDGKAVGRKKSVSQRPFLWKRHTTCPNGCVAENGRSESFSEKNTAMGCLHHFKLRTTATKSGFAYGSATSKKTHPSLLPNKEDAGRDVAESRGECSKSHADAERYDGLIVVADHLLLHFQKRENTIADVVLRSKTEVGTQTAAITPNLFRFVRHIVCHFSCRSPVGEGETENGIESHFFGEVEHIVEIGIDVPHVGVAFVEKTVKSELCPHLVGDEVSSFQADADVFDFCAIGQIQTYGLAILLSHCRHTEKDNAHEQ